MKKPKHKILYGAGMLAMALSLTACDRMEQATGVYGPPREMNEDVYGPPQDTTEEQPDPDDNATSKEKPDAGNSQTSGE